MFKAPSIFLHSSAACRCSPRGRPAQGFTLIELIMVIVIMGVLAVFAAPRIFNSDDFYARGFHDETLGLLRFAQKAAIAQRRTVCVTVTAAAPARTTLSIDSASTGACNTALVSPNKTCIVPGIGSTACIEARAGISYSTTPVSLTSVTFNGLGQPDARAAFQVNTLAGAAGNSIIVEAETGYVHD